MENTVLLLIIKVFRFPFQKIIIFNWNKKNCFIKTTISKTPKFLAVPNSGF
jgi:hypothetical protein